MLDHPLRSGCAAAAWGVCFSLLYTVAFTLWPLKYKRTCPPRHAVPRARQRRKSALERFAAKFFTPSNVLLALLWVAWLGLVVYVQSHAQESVAFDPFHILQARRPAALRAGGPRGHAPCAPVQRCAPSPLSCGLLQAADASGVSARQVERGASAADVRRAYRQLSLVYHPVRRRGRLWAGCAARPPVASAPGAPYYGGEQGWLRPAGQEPRPGGRQVLCGVHNKGVQGAHGCARPPRKPRAALAPSRRPPAGPVPAWGLPDGGPRPQTRPRARTMRSTATRTGRSPSSWTSRCRTGSSRRRAPLNQARRSEHRHAL